MRPRSQAGQRYCNDGGRSVKKGDGWNGITPEGHLSTRAGKREAGGTLTVVEADRHPRTARRQREDLNRSKTAPETFTRGIKCFNHRAGRCVVKATHFVLLLLCIFALIRPVAGAAAIYSKARG